MVSVVEFSYFLVLLLLGPILIDLKNLVLVLDSEICVTRHQLVLALLLDLRALVILDFTVLILYVKQVQDAPQSHIVLVTFGGWL